MANALGEPFDVAFVCPRWMKDQVSEEFATLGARHTTQIGESLGNPGVILIQDLAEAGPQGYELLLRKSARVSLDARAVDDVLEHATESVLLIGDDSWRAEVLKEMVSRGRNVWVDLSDGTSRIEARAEMGPLAGLFVSTSSRAWLDRFEGQFENLASCIEGQGDGGIVGEVVLKENRGGVRVLNPQGGHQAGAVVGSTIHSVGVGDAFDVAYVLKRRDFEPAVAAAISSSLAADYAATVDQAELVRRTTLTLSEPVAFRGLRVPWESRSDIGIYLAAPDFPSVDTAPLDALERALAYHNFRPIRPVLVNGLLEPDAPDSDQLEVALADWGLLRSCQILVATLLAPDPGTDVEIGMATQLGIPVIVYDPFGRARNPMVTALTAVQRTLNGVVESVFKAADKIVR
jgi:nucleoside 2-deoxyribosyltransferase